jgi:hypothetical protein
MCAHRRRIFSRAPFSNAEQLRRLISQPYAQDAHGTVSWCLSCLSAYQRLGVHHLAPSFDFPALIYQFKRPQITLRDTLCGPARSWSFSASRHF